MIGMETSFGRSGVHDWKMQRVSAVFLLAYLIFLTYSVCTLGEFNYANWSALFEPNWVKAFTLLSVVSISVHAWAGLWIISTDYLKPVALRNSFQLIGLLTCLGFIAWTAMIFWG
ncbi:MAG: succinate dehydrogenase, hydrophobic membrane anchor protein [Gammaproteobacteria bacterium]|nr:MAG: succinate dehydrogenase, hydrophobic membrane anchor protein [Gammaproteobacteria bacterium]